MRKENLFFHLTVKSTSNIDDHLPAEAEALAAREGTSLTRRVEEGLGLPMPIRTPQPAPRRIVLPVLQGRGGLVAGIDPLNDKAWLAALDDDA